MEKAVQLHWPGKRAAADAAHAPSVKTLQPERDASVCFDATRNLFIEGDNLDALKLLRASYAGQVKLIYIDPPYNTGHEYVYNDDFGRRHAEWLSMMYPRLTLARELLAADGAIFVSIGSTEHARLVQLLCEVMGEANFRADIVWQKRYTRSNNTRDFSTVVEHIVVFAKSAAFTVNLLPRTPEADARYANPDNDPRGPWKPASFLNPVPPAQRPNLCYPITNPSTGQVTWPTTHAWRRSSAEYERLAADGLLYWGADGSSPVPSVKMFLSEVRGLTPTDFWGHEYAGHTDEGTRDLAALIGGKVFNNPKPVKLMRRVLEHAADPSCGRARLLRRDRNDGPGRAGAERGGRRPPRVHRGTAFGAVRPSLGRLQAGLRDDRGHLRRADPPRRGRAAQRGPGAPVLGRRRRLPVPEGRLAARPVS